MIVKWRWCWRPDAGWFCCLDGGFGEFVVVVILMVVVWSLPREADWCIAGCVLWVWEMSMREVRNHLVYDGGNGTGAWGLNYEDGNEMMGMGNYIERTLEGECFVLKRWG